jgi:hypothetical protein
MIKTGWTHGAGLILRTSTTYKHGPGNIKAAAWNGRSIFSFSYKSNKKLQKTFIFKN